MENKNFQEGSVVYIELTGQYPTHEQQARIQTAVLDFLEALLERPLSIDDVDFTLEKRGDDIVFYNEEDFDLRKILLERADEFEKWLKRSLDEVSFEALEFSYSPIGSESGSPRIVFVVSYNA